LAWLISNRNTNQVLYLADSGVENALWALSNPTAPNAIPSLVTIPARYNSPLPHGSNATFIALGRGGFTVSVVRDPVNLQMVTVTSTGWLPNNTAALAAKKIVTTKLLTLANRFNPPTALNVNGALTVAGSAVVDSRNATCQTSGWQLGDFTTGATAIAAPATVYGSAQDQPAGSNRPTYDYQANQPPSAFTPMILTPDELLALKGRAQASGTYFRPPTGGALTFDASHPLPNGVVFVDTVSGSPIGTPPNAADLASVTINAASASGWLIVMGSITVAGTDSVAYTGLVYAANGLTYTNTGTGAGIRGAVIATNVLPTGASVAGTAKISLDCDAINNNGTGPNWVVVPGSWHEVSG
jgi:hypothetical protein